MHVTNLPCRVGWFERRRTLGMAISSSLGFLFNKNDIPFCARWADHGIEHENHAMKVIRGICSLTSNEEA